MRRKTIATVGFFVVLYLLVLAIGMAIGVLVGETQVRDEALEHDVAEWRCDPATGETEFVWIEKGE